MKKKTIIKVAGFFVALVIFFAIIFITLSEWSLLGTCGNTVKMEVISPDGRNKLVIFERDCGATTSYSTQGMILRKNKKLHNVAGNAFVLDQSEVKATWTDNSTLSVIIEPSAEVYNQSNLVDGITVNYFKQKR